MNYKPYAFARVGKDIVFSVPNQELKQLYYLVAGGGTPVSIHDMSDGLVYQVPSGKKFVALVWEMWHLATVTSPVLYDDTTLHGGSGTVIGRMRHSSNKGSSHISIHAEVAADHYITVDPVTASVMQFTSVIGFETDA